jgi:ABC-type uncharacterized transport system substrate-binding protein
MTQLRHGRPKPSQRKKRRSFLRQGVVSLPPLHVHDPPEGRMAAHIERRKFIFTLASAAAWPFAARAQQPTVPVIGFLSGRSRDEAAYAVAAFQSGLKETGFVEGQNVAVEYRWAEGQEDRLPALAADLVRRQVTAIAATGGSASVLAAKAATTIIPIVFLSGADPVKLGLIANFNRPEGNATGTYVFTTATEGKRLALLRDLVPTAQIVGVLVRPRSTNATIQLNNVEGGSARRGTANPHFPCEQRARDRYGLCELGPSANRSTYGSL